MKLNMIKQQKGLSLIELMIAVALGIFISAGMVSIFTNSSQNYRVNENMSRLQENTRFAMLFLARDIRATDYRACETDARLSNAISGADNNSDAGDDIINGTDSLTVAWQTNACGAAAATTTATYTIENDDAGSPNLVSSIGGELVEGIADMQVLYGEDTDNDNIANYYVAESDVVDMEQVISVRVILTAQTLDDNLTTDGNRITRDFTSTIALRNRLP